MCIRLLSEVFVVVGVVQWSIAMARDMVSI